MMTPLIRSLRTRYPLAEIDMVIREDLLDLIRHNPHLDLKIPFPRQGGVRRLVQLLKMINTEHYDVVYDVHQSLRSRLLMPWIRTDQKIKYSKHYFTRSLALTLKMRFLLKTNRMLERYIEPLKTLGVEWDEKGPEIFFSEKDSVSAQKKAPLPALLPGGAYVGLIPSAQWSGKRWPLKHFQGLAQNLIQRTSCSIILFGGPQDFFCQTLADALPAVRVVNGQGKWNLLEAAAILKQCRFVIANDTGLMHMADALQIPSLVLLGPTSREMGCLPFHPMSQVIEKQLWCRPCSKNGQAPCIRKKRYCLERISPEEVFQAAVGLLQSSS